MSQNKSHAGQCQHRQRVVRISETHILVYVSHHNTIDIKLTPKIASFCKMLRQHFPTLIEIIPSYHSVMIEIHPQKTDVGQLINFLNQALENFEQLKDDYQFKCIELPVFYHPDVAPDLSELAQLHQLSLDEVIQYHSYVDYTVCAIGFAPGFAFLGSVNKAIATPRHKEPRLHVPKGSVGIADKQTAVYPLDSPGGWQVIGNCPIDLSQPPFQVGDKVRFKPIDRQTFIELGGVFPTNTQHKDIQ
ncbi:MAG: 5-oxoprolinase subunit PxpB [Vibrio sp.]